MKRLPDSGQPFVLTAVWIEGPDGSVYMPVPERGAPPPPSLVKIAAANLPGGPLGEFALAGELADAVAQVYPDELPIALSLRLGQLDGRGVWLFDYLGQSDRFSEIWRIPPDVQPTGPRPLTLAELNKGAEDQVREALGIPESEPIPEPAGQLDPTEAAEAPYRFDPTAHMDLDKAEPAPALPPPAAPGPDPTPGAETFAPPPLPPPQTRQHGAFGNESVPFAH
jgi:hypothetical protein